MTGKGLGTREPTCDRFLENISVPVPVFVSRDHTVLMTGALLAFRDVNCGILIEDKQVKHAIYGYQLVNFLLAAPSDQLYKRLFEPVVDAKEIAPGSPLPVMKLTDTCKKALSEIVATRFGNLLFTDPDGRPVGLLSLETMLQALEGKTKRIGLTIREVASPLVLSPNSQPILDVFRSMMANRIRRAVVKVGRRYYYCTEREILRALFSTSGLELIRDDGMRFLSQPIGKIPQKVFRAAPEVGGDIDIASAWTLAVENRASTLIVDGEKIVTPWDLVAKPFLLGKMPF